MGKHNDRLNSILQETIGNLRHKRSFSKRRICKSLLHVTSARSKTVIAQFLLAIPTCRPVVTVEIDDYDVQHILRLGRHRDSRKNKTNCFVSSQGTSN